MLKHRRLRTCYCVHNHQDWLGTDFHYPRVLVFHTVGPVLAWLNCIEAMQETGMEIPINLKFLFEGREESGSEGLDDFVFSKKETFLKDVDFVCISDNYWLGKKKPCLTYGLRGICYFFLEIECSTKDLHSGVFGGTVHKGMADLIALLDTLVDNKGRILIPGINDSVAKRTDEEKKLYEPIDFDPTKVLGAYMMELAFL